MIDTNVIASCAAQIPQMRQVESMKVGNPSDVIAPYLAVIIGTSGVVLVVLICGSR